jgi:hypothetical protein
MANLTNQYNNHSIRATSITLLDTQFAFRDIMKISDHKSEISIKNYSSKTSDDKLEKISNFWHRTVVGTSTVSESAETSDESVDENQNVANDHNMTENIRTDFVYLEQEQIDELLGVQMPKENDTLSAITNKENINVLPSSNQSNNMMMPQFKHCVMGNSAFTPYITGHVVNFNESMNKQ